MNRIKKAILVYKTLGRKAFIYKVFNFFTLKTQNANNINFSNKFKNHDDAIKMQYGTPEPLFVDEISGVLLRDLNKLIQDAGDESVIATLLNSKDDKYLLIDNHANSVIQELDSILIVHPIHSINPMQETISRLHKELRNIFKAYIKSPFVFVNTRAWSTKANSSKFGPSLMHNDGFEPGHMKIMVYLTHLNAVYGYFMNEGGFINNRPAGTSICFLNSDLEHGAVPGNTYNRICIEVTLMRAFVDAPQLNMGAFFGRHALSPEVVYDAATKMINK